MIDLNADLGEGMGDDLAMLEIVTSASIACGGHAGDAHSMRRAVRGALHNGVRIGAHPGFVDPHHFGRRRLDIPTDRLSGQIVAQVAQLHDIAQAEGAVITYLKLHGALANMAAEDRALAKTLFAAVDAAFPGLSVLALAASEQEWAARDLGLDVILEAYADRAYTADGQLVSRARRGSVITDEQLVIDRCLRLAETGEIVAIDGTVFKSEARSICLHGDTPGALDLARAVRAALAKTGAL